MMNRLMALFSHLNRAPHLAQNPRPMFRGSHPFRGGPVARAFARRQWKAHGGEWRERESFRRALVGPGRAGRGGEHVTAMNNKDAVKTTNKLTIDRGFYAVVVHDAEKHILRVENTTGRPYALSHAIAWAEEHGEIDWENSEYEQPKSK